MAPFLLTCDPGQRSGPPQSVARTGLAHMARLARLISINDLKEGEERERKESKSRGPSGPRSDGLTSQRVAVAHMAHGFRANRLPFRATGTGEGRLREPPPRRDAGAEAGGQAGASDAPGRSLFRFAQGRFKDRDRGAAGLHGQRHAHRPPLLAVAVVAIDRLQARIEGQPQLQSLFERQFEVHRLDSLCRHVRAHTSVTTEPMVAANLFGSVGTKPLLGHGRESTPWRPKVDPDYLRRSRLRCRPSWRTHLDALDIRIKRFQACFCTFRKLNAS